MSLTPQPSDSEARALSVTPTTDVQSQEPASIDQAGNTTETYKKVQPKTICQSKENIPTQFRCNFQMVSYFEAGLCCTIKLELCSTPCALDIYGTVKRRAKYCLSAWSAGSGQTQSRVSHKLQRQLQAERQWQGFHGAACGAEVLQLDLFREQ